MPQGTLKSSKQAKKAMLENRPKKLIAKKNKNTAHKPVPPKNHTPVDKMIKKSKETKFVPSRLQLATRL